MLDWFELFAAYALFLISHVLPVLPPVKLRLLKVLGQGGYSLVYSTVSLGFMAWVIVAAGRAPLVELLEWAEWQLWVPNVVMPVAIWLAVSAILTPNPLSFGGPPHGYFAPDAPGVVGLVRHPLLWALLLWSASHAIANPDLAHVLVFGGFAVFSGMGMRAIDRRNQKRMGLEQWQRLACNTSNLPRLSALWPIWALFPMRVVMWTLLFWISFLYMHAPIMGVQPYPMVPEFLYRVSPGLWV